ncbi:MAG: bifunctional adenosylcobinamide kinase/adenosylcobinamide-phosphate guanylyltransferase [Gammaproteobacteria bacterium]|jgi:adenosylcobinamide kinase / adenosylcobinamide-phosphate guanylyltransferase|nr:bifunctional adenosylcobinamide kinase/adenosylcobinamide-phosphate guanylyltransferase [Gammaproteobacteria bacterium]MBT7308578.1 bifunctional adenosylcobinamide kinase/adenosylcobinamide-phosphate guanylyltransferase [Gammaproteobacteria bacterium]
MRELILGGVRSGKSRYAEEQALGRGGELLYLATATAGDGEMAQRIVHHQQQRSPRWQLIEEPIALPQMLQQEAKEGRTIVVECLTLWLTNLLMDDDEVVLRWQQDWLVELLPTLSGNILLVSNEVGMGVVPPSPLSRRFCDESGRLHQRLAQCCERVTWVVAGLPQTLKGIEHG